MKEKISLINNQKFIVFFLFSLILFLVYFPFFITDFGVHNDYNLNFKTSENYQIIRLHPETNTLLLLGRPLNAIFASFQYSSIHSLEGLSYARFFNFLLTLALGYIFYSFLLKNFMKDNPLFAGTLLLTLFTLPAFQLNILWVSQVVPNLITYFVSIGAYFLLEKVRQPKQYPFLYLFCAYTCFVSALLIYPPSAMIFLCFTLAYTLFSPDWEKARKRAIQDLIFCFIGMGMFFLPIKLVFIPFSRLYIKKNDPAYLHTAAKEFETSINIKKMILHLEDLSWQTIGDWFVPHAERLLLLLFPLLILACFISSARFFFLKSKQSKKKTPPWSLFLQNLVFVGGIIVVINFPILIPSATNTGFRMVLPFTIAIIFLLFSILHFLLHYPFPCRAVLFFRGVSIFIALYSTAFGQNNVINSMLNAKMELDYVWQKVVNADLTQIKNIVFVRPDHSEILLNRTLSVEFRQMGLNYGFQEGIVEVVRDKTGLKEKNISLTVLGLFDREELDQISSAHETTLIIDLNEAILRKYDDNH